MENETVNVTINLDALRNELRIALQRVIYLVSAGLKAAEGIDPENLQLPTVSMAVTYASNLKFTPVEIKQQYTSWILTNGFRDSIECVSAFLESVHKVLSVWKLTGKQNETVQIKAADWNATFVDGIKKFHRLGFPDKLNHIRNEHDIEMDEKFVDLLLSINTARNCLVHRNGIVSDRDITADSKLEVKWTTLMFVLQNEDGEKELVIGQLVEKESWVGVRPVGQVKTFDQGAKIEFSTKEFSDITWTSFLFGEDLVTKIHSYAVKSGIMEAATNNA